MEIHNGELVVVPQNIVVPKQNTYICLTVNELMGQYGAPPRFKVALPLLHLRPICKFNPTVRQS